MHPRRFRNLRIPNPRPPLSVFPSDELPPLDDGQWVECLVLKELPDFDVVLTPDDRVLKLRR